MKVSEFLALLKDNVEVADLISSGSLTFASLVVAGVALRYAHIQNYGFKPFTLVYSHGLRGQNNVHKMTLVVHFWNRRAYPVMVEAVRVRVGSLVSILDKRPSAPKGWYFTGDSIYKRDSIVIQQNIHEEFELEWPFVKDVKFDGIDAVIEVEVIFFDPRKSKLVTTRSKRWIKYSRVKTPLLTVLKNRLQGLSPPI